MHIDEKWVPMLGMERGAEQHQGGSSETGGG